MAIGFAEHAQQGWWADGQVWVLVKPNARYNVNVDGTELSLIGGEKPIPTTFDPNGSNTVKLVYDPVAKTAELWINAVRVMGPTAIPNGSDGLPPAIHYAGWSALNASQNETGVDNFDLSVGAGSVKRAFDGSGADTPSEGSSPTFDFQASMTSSEPFAVESALKGKASTTGSITYTWTPLDGLESATTPEGTETYSYDGDGLRISKTSGNETVFYIRDGQGRIIAEYDGQGDLLAEYVYAMGRRIAKISASGMRFYYHTDNVGTPLAITDQNGNLSWRGEYLPFGSEFSSADPGDHFKFTGKELEDHTGLYYFEARYYDPVIGRFISVDPVGGNVGNSQSWNRYSYVENRPVRFVDPTGGEGFDVNLIEDIKRTARFDDANFDSSQFDKGLMTGFLCGVATGPLAGVAVLSAPEVAPVITSLALNPQTPHILNNAAELVAPPGSPSVSSLRSQYLRQVEVLGDSAQAMVKNGASAEEAVRALNPARNQLKMQIREAGPWLAARWADMRNLIKYGNRSGPSPDDLVGRYGTWEKALEAMTRTNPTVNRVTGN